MRYGAKNPAIKGNDENAHRPAAAPFDHYKAMHGMNLLGLISIQALIDSFTENKEYLKMSEKLDQNLDWKLKGVYVKSKGEVKKETQFSFVLKCF